MANTPRNNTNQLITNLKICTLNVCGYSERCTMTLNHYIDKEKIDWLATQETGTSNEETLKLHSMNFISDTNKAANRGAALYVNQLHSITKLSTISKMSKNLDSCWGLVVAHKKKYIVGSIYINRNHKPAINETMTMLTEAEKKKIELKAAGIILMGDFNARHVAWGDKLIDHNGKCLAESLDNCQYSICTSKTPTYLCANGSSYIDLAIVSNNLVESLRSCVTDEEVHLFTGSPARGHVPVILELSVTKERIRSPVIEKLDISKMKWDDWTSHIENSIEVAKEYLTNEENPFGLCNTLNTIINEATREYGVTKKSSHYSKPFWTENLTVLSNKLRALRKHYIKRNTENNLTKLNQAREAFDEEIKLTCQNFLINTASKLNSANALKFWKEFNKLFRKKSTNKIDPLFDHDGNLQTDNRKIEQCLFSTFFEAKHLTTGNFDEMFYQEVNNIYTRIIEEEQSEPNDENVNNLNKDITLKEMEKAIKATGKSFDNLNFHPTMFRHLGPSAKSLLVTIFNACLKKHIWIWQNAEVIFLRKSGKDSYAKPGSYRPICITSYIGKLFETILATRIEIFLQITQQTDPNQEGFSPRKNTIRYLNRLHLGILADKEKHLTILCLFIDFEKAFDSVWKKGLLFKLHKLGIKGHIAQLLNSFLFTRKVSINVNGEIGCTRQCSEYGLPQGSVLSPILFRIYVQDLLQEITNNPSTSVYKFADDGTVKISAQNSQTCIQILDHVLDLLITWTGKWRMKINTDKDKTEVICFNTSEGNREIIPKSFRLGDNEILKVKETKVLGLIMDEDLSYISHSKLVLQSLHQRWAILCKYSNRHWGFHLHVMLYLIHALFISKMSYASHIWMNKKNMSEINQLWYHIMKSIIGAVLNIGQNIAEFILGIPPIHIQTKVNSIKHFLKIINKPVQCDNFKDFLINTYDAETKSPLIIHYKYRDTFEFLGWKLLHHPSQFTQTDRNIIESNQYSNYFHLSEKSCSYTQNMMKQYTGTVLWASSLRNQFQLNGHHSSPSPSCYPISIPKETPRKAEVQLVSLFYKNNLLNQSLYNIGQVASPLCRYCHLEEETPSHLIFNCNYIDANIRNAAYLNYRKALNLNDEDPEPESYIGLLNAIRNESFIKSCIDIVRLLNFEVTTNL